MASFHFSAQVIKRSNGRSAIAAAAYRSGKSLRDEGTGKTYDFSRRRGVVFSEILVPDGAAEFLRDRQSLWNCAQRMERRQDAQLAREINLALPYELDAERRRETLLKFVREAFVDRGMVADVAIHAPVLEKRDDPRNYHAHIMLTLRRATKDGLHPVKTREWNSPEMLKQWRALWCLHANQALERAGVVARLDHRTLVAQREDAMERRDLVAAILLDRKPQIHVGPRAKKIVKQGRLPRSKDRMVGPVRQRATHDRPARRQVRYTTIDKGSRVAYRAKLARQRSQSLFESIKRWQARSARLRLRKKRLMLLEALARVNFRRLLGNGDYGWIEKREIPYSLARQVEDAARRLAHVKRRLGQLDALMAEVDRTLAGLLLSQARGPGRSALVLQSNNPRVPVRAGRSRARYPIAPSIFSPGSV